MKRRMLLHMDDVSKQRFEKINELILACEKNDKTEIIKKVDLLVKASSSFILTSFEFQYRSVDREGPFQLLICVGTEMLLNAIVIMESPERYVEIYKRGNRLPGFETIKNYSKTIITKEFDKKQRKHMSDVFDLILSKRNIFAHFSLGIHALYYQHYEILNVILFLFSKYFPSETDAIQKISEIKEKFRIKNEPDYDFVDFN